VPHKSEPLSLSLKFYQVANGSEFITPEEGQPSSGAKFCKLFQQSKQIGVGVGGGVFVLVGVGGTGV
jgi:hypothetical protein